VCDRVSAADRLALKFLQPACVLAVGVQRRRLRRSAGDRSDASVELCC
jgi:hypothetical protein